MKLVYKDAKSHKFWNISVEDDSYTVTYGKVGTQGQSKTKSFDSKAKCKQAADKLIKEKLKKGYKQASDKQATSRGAKKTDLTASVFSGFLKELGGEKAQVHPKIDELERRYNLPLPGDLKRLFNAMLHANQGIGLQEWSLSPDEIAPDLGKKNRFEKIIQLDQGNYLGTWMQELFSNSVYLGQLGNGDAYYAALKWVGSGA